MELVGKRQILHRVALVGRDDHRHRTPAQQVGHVQVARAHARPRVDHQYGDVGVGKPARDCSLDLPASGSCSSRSTPPVSISVKGRPFQSVSSSLRSRVTPGSSCTTASRVLGEAVDQRGLADVRISDDCDLHASMARGLAGRPQLHNARRCARTTWSSAQPGRVEHRPRRRAAAAAIRASAVALVANRLLGEHPLCVGA